MFEVRSPLPSRRGVLALAAASMAFPLLAPIASRSSAMSAATKASSVTARDGTKLFIQETGQGAPVVFIHGWSLNSDVWREQFAGLAGAGARCIGYDRRGHGRSGRPNNGYDYDTLSDDLDTVFKQLNLRDVTLVAHSMGAGEVVRFLMRGGDSRVSRIALLAPTTPYLLQGPDNPNRLPLAALDKLRAALTSDYAGYFRANVRSGLSADTPQEVVDWAIGLSLRCSLDAAIACTHTYSETDFRGDLPRVDKPTLILQGDSDALPLDWSGKPTAALIKGSTLKVYPGARHGFFLTHKEAVNADLHAFVRS